MLEQFVLANIENSLNALLRTDAPALARLQQLAGRVLQLRLRQPDQSIFLVLHGDGISLSRNWQSPPDCCLTADAATFVALASSQEQQKLLHRPDVSIEGNSALLQEISAIMQDLQLDWEYLLQQWLGPLATGLLASHLRQRISWLRHGSDAMLDNFADYLSEETRLLVGRNEYLARFAGLAEDRLQLDRLEARVAILSQRMSAQS